MTGSNTRQKRPGNYICGRRRTAERADRDRLITPLNSDLALFVVIRCSRTLSVKIGVALRDLTMDENENATEVPRAEIVEIAPTLAENCTFVGEPWLIVGN